VVLDVIQGKWGQAWDHLKDLASTAFHAAIDVIKEIASGFGNLLLSAGKALVQGLINGIKDMFGAAFGAVKDLASGLVSTAKSFLHIFSPSRVFQELGNRISEGLAVGITETKAKAQRAAEDLAKATYEAFKRGQLTRSEYFDLEGRIEKDLRARMGDLAKFTRQVGLELATGIRNGLEGNASQVKAAADKLFTIVKEAWEKGDITYGRSMRLTDMIERDNQRLQSLATRRSAILKEIQKAEKFAQQTTSALRGDAGLANLASVQNASNGGALYSGDVLADLQAQLAQIKQFGQALARLKKVGLDKNLINQIIQMGPAQGLQVAQALLDGPVSVIKQMDQTQTQISKATTNLGKQAADEMYDSGKQAGKGFLSGLESQQKHLEAMMRKLARSMVHTIRKELGIHSPSTVMAQHGMDAALGLAQGIEQGESRVAASSKKLTAALTGSVSAPGAGSAAGTGGNGSLTIGPITVHVTGFVGSNSQLAEEIYTVVQQQALRHDRRNSTNGLQLVRGRT
jgi:hypothetical protein